MSDAYAGIDVAIAKGKRVPIAVCVWRGNRLVPLILRAKGLPSPPCGRGNVDSCDEAVRARLAAEVVDYLHDVERAFGVSIKVVGIDAPSAPRPEGAARRHAEQALADRGISYIQTPSAEAFAAIGPRVRAHLNSGGTESCLPCANLIWMLFGFDLYGALAEAGMECIEVYPQATVRLLGAGGIYKAAAGGVQAQLSAVSLHTRWPDVAAVDSLKAIAWGSIHDRLDAYLAAWVAALPARAREPLGLLPGDVIWIPRVKTAAGAMISA